MSWGSTAWQGQHLGFSCSLKPVQLMVLSSKIHKERLLNKLKIKMDRIKKKKKKIKSKKSEEKVISQQIK